VPSVTEIQEPVTSSTVEPAASIVDAVAIADALVVAPLTRRSVRAAAPVVAPLTRRAARGRELELPALSEVVGAEVVELLAVEPEAAEQAPAAATVVEIVASPPRELPLALPTSPVAHAHTAAESAPRADAPAADADASAPSREADDVDAFAEALRRFAQSGPTPIISVAESAPEQVIADEAPTGRSHRGRGAKSAPASAPSSALPRKSVFRRVATTSFSIGAMGIVGLVAVGMTLPSQAVAAASGTASVTNAVSLAASNSTGGGESAIQAFAVPSEVQTSSLDRSDYTTGSKADMAASLGISHFSNFFTNNPNSPIQWPFAVGVSISYGFGWRTGEFHEGLDFTPGAGAKIQAVADGVVRVATESGGGYGVMIIIDHVIDGQPVATRYAHMAYGSLRVKAGDHVKVGEIIGQVGDTGYSFGAHLHFEVLQNGTTPIDPLPWLRSHAGG
jgi:murein DD-endopeptidase MepM/ murein hydrolase activator NlpD